MKQDSNWFVYEDWTTEDTPRCFYVGKGDQVRLRRTYRNKHHSNVKKKYGFDRRVVLETDVESRACEEEIRIIAERHTYVHDPCYNGIGTNYTTGGEGVSGHKDTPEQRQKRSRSQKRAWADAEKAKSRILARNRQETNEKLAPLARESQIKNWSDPEYREKQCQAIKEAQNDPTVQEKRRESNKEASLRLWQDPEHREKLAKIFESEEYRQKMSVALKGKQQRCGFCKEPGHKHFTCPKKHETNTNKTSSS